MSSGPTRSARRPTPRLSATALRAAAALLALGASASATPAAPNDDSPLPSAHADLVALRAEEDGFSVVGVDDEAMRRLADGVRSGTFTPDTGRALRFIFHGLARQQGALAVSGRLWLSDLSGAAAASGSRASVRGMSDVLLAVMEDALSQYSLLAQDLLAEMMRCAATSIDDTETLQRITERLDPDRGLGLDARRRTVGDRFGLHAGADLMAVAARGPRVVAAGRIGSILVSNDSGQSFATPDTRTDQAFFAAALGPGDEIWAAGRVGTVLRSTDGGQTFSHRAMPFDRHLFGLFAPSHGSVLAVGDFGLQIRTQDGGAHWECVPRGEDVILGRIAPAAGDAVVVGEFGTLERLTGSGPPVRRGELRGVPPDLYVFDVWFDAEGESGVAVGLEGTVLRSADGGTHWERVEVPFDADLYGVAGAGDDVVVVGEGGFVGHSADRGRSFRAADEGPPLPLPLYDVDFADTQRVYAVGPRGLVIASDDAGRHFVAIHGPGSGETP